MVVDWSKPIEAVHEDGRVENAYQYREGAVWPDYQGQYHVGYGADRDLAFVNSDGSPWNNNKITVRNTTTPATTPPIPAPIAERMRELIEEVALLGYGAWAVKAKAIMAELVPVDGDLLEARKIEAQICREADREDEAVRVENGEFDDRPGMKGVLDAIKRGRELEREGRK